MKIKCKECSGEGAYEYANWETSKMENIECSYCDGQGYYEEDIEEFTGKQSVTYVDNLCDRMKAKLQEDAEAVFLAFSPRDQKTYHITYFIERGDVTKESTPLLGGLTLSAESITHAITSFMNTSGVSESEIKYIVEL